MNFKETEIGLIPCEWEYKSIGDCLYIKGRIGWKGLKKSEYLKKSNYRIINGSALNGKDIEWDKCGYISEERYNESPEIMLEKNDIVMTKDGTIGKVAIIDKLEYKTTVASGLFVIRVLNNSIDYKYLYYYFTSKYFSNLVKTRIEGSVIPHLYQKDLVELNIPLPQLNEQKAISKILSDLDKKIETNNKINKKLEEMAQAIFKQWFVDFEFPNEDGKPYKSSGGEMVESELGMIPKGWEVKSIDDLTIKFTTGLNPRKNFVLGKGNNYYVTIKNMGNQSVILDDKCDSIDDDAISIINKRSDLKKGDILFSGIGTIGRTYLLEETPTNWNISESIFTLRAYESNLSLYLYFLMLSPELQGYAKQLASGSVQKGIRMADLKKFSVAFSEKLASNEFNEIISSIINKYKENERENKSLIELRNTLLPKLMSGEIRVPLV